MSQAEMEHALAMVETYVKLETERPSGPNVREWAANLGWESKYACAEGAK